MTETHKHHIQGVSTESINTFTQHTHAECVFTNKMLKKTNMIPNFPRGTAVASSGLITGHDCSAPPLHKLSSYPPPVCVYAMQKRSTPQ